MSPAWAASSGVAARARGPSSATRSFSVSGPRELLTTTSCPCVTASRASWLPMWPAPISPIVLMGPLLFRARDVHHQIVLEPDELVELRFQDPLLIAMRAVPL